jgi:NADPH:quinone reductase-like Zn-dependent oxidoreductase
MIAAETLGESLNVLVPPFTSRSVLGRPTTARLRAVVDAVARGALRVRIEERIPLAEAERALALSQAGRMTGKIVLIP